MYTDIDLDFETLLYEKKRIAIILLADIKKHRDIAQLSRDFDREKFNFHIGNAFLLLDMAEKLLFPPSTIEPEISVPDRLEKLEKFSTMNLD